MQLDVKASIVLMSQRQNFLLPSIIVRSLGAYKISLESPWGVIRTKGDKERKKIKIKPGLGIEPRSLKVVASRCP
jgi:hypothetical protein